MFKLEFKHFHITVAYLHWVEKALFSLILLCSFSKIGSTDLYPYFPSKSFIYFSMETITLGDKRIGIKTSVLEEKATACNMLCCYADELKEGFFPWIDQVQF